MSDAPPGGMASFIWVTGRIDSGLSGLRDGLSANPSAPNTSTIALTPRTTDFVRGLNTPNSLAWKFERDFCAVLSNRPPGALGYSFATTWAARRAAATKLARAGAAVSVAFAEPFTACDAAIRSIALATTWTRRAPEPGSSGTSGARSGPAG